MRNRRFVVLASLFVLVACGGSNNPGDNGGDSDTQNTAAVDVSLTPADLTLAAGTSGSVTVGLARAASAQGETVAMTVSGAPSGVTAVLDSASTTADTVKLTIAVDFGVAASTSTLVIQATDATGVSRALLQLTVTALPAGVISGRVVSFLSESIWGKDVKIWSAGSSAPQTVTTGADGRFTASNVVAPYDVVVMHGQVRALFLGATSTTPTFTLSDDITPSTGRTSTITGSLTNGTSGDTLYAVAETRSSYSGNSSTGTVSLTFDTLDSAPQTCDFAALQVHKNGDAVDGYGGYGTSSFSLTPGANVTTDTVDLGTALITRNIIYSFGGGAADNLSLIWTFGKMLATTIGTYPLAAGSSQVLVPADPKIAMSLLFRRVDANGVTYLVRTIPSENAGSIDVTSVPDATLIMSPASNATLTDESSISTFNPANGLTYAYEFLDEETSAITVVVTQAPEIIPAVLGAHGIPLRSGKGYEITVSTYGGFGVDQDFSLGAINRKDNGYLSSANLIPVTTQ